MPAEIFSLAWCASCRRIIDWKAKFPSQLIFEDFFPSFPLDHRSTQRHSLTEPLILQLSVQSELFWQKVSPAFHLTLRNIHGFTCKSNQTSYMRAQTSLFHARRAPIPIDYRLREIKAEFLRIYLHSIINKLQIFARNLSTRFPAARRSASMKWYFNRAAEWKIFLLRDLFWWKPEYINYARFFPLASMAAHSLLIPRSRAIRIAERGTWWSFEWSIAAMRLCSGSATDNASAWSYLDGFNRAEPWSGG